MKPGVTTAQLIAMLDISNHRFYVLREVGTIPMPDLDPEGAKYKEETAGQIIRAVHTLDQRGPG